MRRRPHSPVPSDLSVKIADALARVDSAQARLASATTTGSPVTVRRSAHAELRNAYESADTLLRQGARCAKQQSYVEWSRWRTRLSRLDTARQAQLFAEADDLGVLGLGTIRALDTGMSGPAIGDLLHGESSPPRARAHYGLDEETMLDGWANRGRPAAASEADRPDAPPRHATIVPLPVPTNGAPLEAA
jgi:hypothetical protein